MALLTSRYTHPLPFACLQCPLPYEKRVRFALNCSRLRVQQQLHGEWKQPWPSSPSRGHDVSKGHWQRGGKAGCPVSKLDLSSGSQISGRGDGLRKSIQCAQSLSERRSILNTLWDSSRLWRVWSRIQFPSPPRGSCWAPRQRFQCGTWSSWGLKTKPHISSFAFLCKPQVLSFPSQHSDIRLRGPFFQYLFGAKSQPLPDAAPGQWAAWVHLELGRSKPPPWWWEQGAALHHSLWAPLSLGWVSCPQCIPGTSWIACALLCCPSSRCQGGWSLPWGPGLLNMRLLLYDYRGPHPLARPGHVDSHCNVARMVKNGWTCRTDIEL